MYASLRIQPILKAFPSALFIQINRNEVDTGRSLLEVRKRVFGSYEQWWSMEPPNINELRDMPCEQQVIEQVRSIYHTIDTDLTKMGASKTQVYEASYEKLCEAPEDLMKEIEDFLLGHGIAVKRISGILPNQFSKNKQGEIPRELFHKLERYASESRHR